MYMESESEIVSQQQKRPQSSDNVLVTPPTTPPIVVPYAERCERRRRNLRRDRAKAYRDLTSMRVQLTCQKRATMRYKKRLQRLKETSDSPAKTSTAHLVKGTRPGQAGAEVRRVLSFHSALSKQDNREHITKQLTHAGVSAHWPILQGSVDGIVLLDFSIEQTRSVGDMGPPATRATGLSFE